MKDVYIATNSHICAICGRVILPGMQYKHIQREYADKEGNKAIEWAKVHTWHEEGPAQ